MLSAGEKAKYTAQRKALVEAEYPETKATYDGGKFRGNQHKKEVATDSVATSSFRNATAKATGRSETTVGLDAERGEKINGKALDALSGTALDKGVYLDRLKTVPMEKQHKVVNPESGATSFRDATAKATGRGRNRDPDSGSLSFIDSTAKATAHGMHKALGHNVNPESGLTFIDSTAKATGRGKTTVSLDAERGETRWQRTHENSRSGFRIC